MRIFIFLLVILTFNSCANEEKTNEVKQPEVPQRSELSKDSKIHFGNRLFSEKTCITCHAIDKKKVGPSVIDIMAIYKEQNTSIEAFLKGNSQPIVDTTASQVAIMQDNINGFLKKVTDEELDAIATYMFHVAELNSK